MRILLDTHIWLWLNQSPKELPTDALEKLTDEANVLYLSAASAWEIAIKHQLKKLHLPMPPEIYIPKRLSDNGILALPIDLDHTLRASALPMHHKDPFDRMIVAQAMLEDLMLMTADPHIKLYETSMIWVAR